MLIGNKVRGKVTAIELHAFNKLMGGLKCFAFFDGDYAIFAYFVECFSNDGTDFVIIVGCNSCNILKIFLKLNRLAVFFKAFDDFFDSFFNAALHHHRVNASNNGFEAFVENSFCHYGCSGGAIACDIAGFACNFAHHACAHVFILVFKIDFLGNGNTVFSYQW